MPSLTQRLEPRETCLRAGKLNSLQERPLRLTYLDCAAVADDALSEQVMRSGVVRHCVESRRPGECAKDALANYATAIKVAPQPADDLPSEIAQGILA